MKLKLVGSTNNIGIRPKLLNKFFRAYNQRVSKRFNLNLLEEKTILTNLEFREDTIKEILRFSQNFARTCYSEKDWDGLIKEGFNEKLLNNLLKAGHHSIFEHTNFNFYINGFPKIFMMMLNNEKQYATSEKSARYTIMENIETHQRELYEKWFGIFSKEITKIYPQKDSKKRDDAIRKLAQENARYMTSVFTPTKMGHTLNFRQLNFIINGFEKFIENPSLRQCGKDLGKKLTESIKEFSQQLAPLRVNKLDNQTDRNLSLFNPIEVEEYFGDTYATNYLMSFAGLAQAHRHRTIDYHISEGTELMAPLGFFIPKLIKGTKLENKWVDDLKSVAEYDFPQAQLVKVNETGKIEDFRSKTFLRMCGHAQHETMKNTLRTAKKYKKFQEVYGENSLKPKCAQGVKCAGPCVWGEKKALERIV